MAQRRSHQKSRHGCLECKRRRVKCDETRPVCANCARRQTECEYDSSGPLRWMTDEPSRSPRSTSDRQQRPSPDLSLLGRLGNQGNASGNDAALPALNLCDLELMMHWYNEMYLALSRNPKTEIIWRLYIPEEALSHPFLMHGMLAASALHIARTRPARMGSDGSPPGRDYLQVAVAHQNQALALFRDQLGSIDIHNGKAMFAFAGITVLYAFGFPHQPDPNNPGSTAVEDLLQAFVLVRGMQQILNQTMATVFEDPKWAPMRDLEDYDVILSGNAQAAVDRLHKANGNCARQDPILHDSLLYQETIDNLADLMAGVKAGMGFSLACRFAIKLQAAFVDRVRERRPLAMVIMVHYCAVMHQLRDVWFGDEWGTRVAQEIWYILDDQWRPLVHSSMEQIFGERYLNFG
ncbi:hypothetical protein P175DRAFT_0557089 [Aspergillus ochraceoroseus IBT 24754]|uniref:Zn(2)-C6 fungal-type domain-containing protein n=1 Tax=Aspergillus ochraceoroseus IBT 24754 TaxID=1392256 RepID=A0A2T5M0V3_9EURO|nr:uncharacterized protein P175DRAFT_0557089 [Aspergillus ochraceoroseus IBT 24754]PTU22163.1 hypothetical protein P175DRAFT_0557089 [Aspergillus ochraceoroseus IBT 24754]